MSRSQYSDDCDGWDLIRYRGAVTSAVRSVRGQELLHGLASALDAMPVKELIADELIDSDGSVCALGALGCAMGRSDEMRKVDPEDYEQVARFFDVAESLAREVQYINDEPCWREDSPKKRWERVRLWVDKALTGRVP